MTKQEFAEIILAIERSAVSAPSQFLSPVGGLNITRLFKTAKFKIENYKFNPYFFKPCGTLVFCGSQGEGKTLSAVSYIKNVLEYYPHAILCTNTRIRGRPVNAYIHYSKKIKTELEADYEEVFEERREAFFLGVIEELKDEFYDIKYPETTVEDYINLNLASYYFDRSSDFEDYCQSEQYQLRDILTDEPITTKDIIEGKFKNVTVQYSGLDCLKYINNDKCGVIFFIDEIHLELNSLESKNVPVEVMVEISQQRKQRKHIVGTSQRYNRMAKPLREQVKDIVACKNFFGAIQYNKYIDGDSTHEVNGELAYDIKRRMLWFHSPEMYKSYDTYVKMRRYNNEWQGRPQLATYSGGVLSE